MRYWHLRRWLPRMGLGYVLAGLLAAGVPGFEVFPFFSWFLFPIVPTTELRYELVLHRHVGAAIEPPRDLQEMKIFSDPTAMDLWLATQRLGKELTRDGEAGAAATRALIEANFVCAGSEYAVHEVRFDVLDRWVKKETVSRRELVRWESKGPCRSSPWAR